MSRTWAFDTPISNRPRLSSTARSSGHIELMSRSSINLSTPAMWTREQGSPNGSSSATSPTSQGIQRKDTLRGAPCTTIIERRMSHKCAVIISPVRSLLRALNAAYVLPEADGAEDRNSLYRSRTVFVPAAVRRRPISGSSPLRYQRSIFPS